MDIRQTIAERMAQRDISQAELARLAQTSRAGVNRYLAGTQDWTGETLGRVLTVLGLRICPERKGGRK